MHFDTIATSDMDSKDLNNLLGKGNISAKGSVQHDDYDQEYYSEE